MNNIPDSVPPPAATLESNPNNSETSIASRDTENGMPEFVTSCLKRSLPIHRGPELDVASDSSPFDLLRFIAQGLLEQITPLRGVPFC